MRHVYSLLLYLLTPALLVYFLIRGFADRGWWRRWPERFCRARGEQARGGILVHAVSVGEVNAAVPLIRALLERWPELPVTVTCFTPTASARITARFGDAVHHVYAPIDLPGAVQRFFKRHEPRLLVVMETEIWPNLFRAAKVRGVPIVIANARLTERSSRGWARFGGLAAEALDCVTLVAAQSEADASRFIALGASPDRVQALGNLKFDLALPESLSQQAAALRAQWGEQRSVLVAGSTHEGDETPLVDAFKRLLRSHPTALLVMAPRYPERFGRAAEAAAAAGLTVGRLSEDGLPDATIQCLVVDRMGELLRFYAAADIAFVGGTLAPVGGHNPLEPAALGKPLILGPHLAHIEHIAADLLEAGAAVRVESADALLDAWTALQLDPARRARMGDAAQRLVEKEQGALERTLGVIRGILLE